MIVEFFGPPGAGKTTFALALAARLREVGHTVDLHVSARPGEERAISAFNGEAPAGRNLIDPLRRLARPLAQLIALRIARASANDPSTDLLVANLPRRHQIAALRMKQYLIRLSAAWRSARNSERIAIFDQGYVQTVSSILLAMQSASDDDVMAMLSAAPASDLAIRIEAPITDIEGRLRRRAQTIGRLGRLFESDLGRPTDHARAADCLQSGLRRAGRAILSVNSNDDHPLVIDLERARQEIDKAQMKAKAESVS